MPVKTVEHSLAVNDPTKSGSVVSKGAPAPHGGPHFGAWLLPLKTFSDLDVARLFQLLEVSSEVAVSQVVKAGEGGKVEDFILRKGHQGSHQLEPGGLVNQGIELHASCLGLRFPTALDEYSGSHQEAAPEDGHPKIEVIGNGEVADEREGRDGEPEPHKEAVPP